MIAHYMEQGSQAWHQIRAGKVTASEVAKVSQFVQKGSKEKGNRRIEESAGRADLRAVIIAEILTGMPDMDGFKSKYMERGIELEPLAKAAYQLETGTMLEEVGFIEHGSIERYGASPDGLLKRGGLEIKIPKTSTHIKWLLDGIVPLEHEAQCYSNIDCAETDWWDFMSFDNRLPKPLDRFIVRLKRNNERIQAMQQDVIQFHRETDAVISWLREKYGEFTIPAQMAAKTLPKALDGFLTEADFAGLA